MTFINKKNEGYSLVELATVTAVVGVLSATAVPRLVDIEKYAQEAAVASIASNFEQAVNQAQMVFYAHFNGINSAGANDLRIWGIDESAGVVDFNGYGYPTKNDIGDNGVNISSATDCVSLWYSLLKGSATLSASDRNSDYYVEFKSPGCLFNHNGTYGYSFYYDPIYGEVEFISTE